MFAVLLVPSASAAETTRIIVKRDAGLSAAERSDIRSDAGVRLVDTLSLPRTEVVTAPIADAREALRELRSDADVEYAELDLPVRASTNDDYYPWLWALRNTGQETPDIDPEAPRISGTLDADMDTPEAWARSTGAGQTVAVVDTGVSRHEDFQEGDQNNLAPGVDWIDNDLDVTDANGHGTVVAGIIAAIADNDLGIAGVAPDARILPLRALGANGSGLTSDIVAALDYAGDQGVRVVNASFGRTTPSQAELDAIRTHPDTLFVAASGNRGEDIDSAAKEYPCAYDLPNIVCVGASDANDARAEFSDWGADSVDIFAPGDRIFSLFGTNAYANASGTSMAAPQVAGEAALVLARNPGLDIPALKAAVLTGDDIPAFNDLSVTGMRANALLAVDSVAADIDGDGHPDGADNCPEVGNPDQADDDENGSADACEDESPDSDGDGIAGATDACPYQRVVGAANGCPGTLANSDGDTVPDVLDNCKLTVNQNQADLDRDGIGDACDADRDGDGRVNGADNCVTVSNPTQLDSDRDRAGDACDADDDNDGRPDSVDQCRTVYAKTANGCPAKPATPAPAIPDSDGDGRRNNVDACPYERALGTLNGCPLPAVTAVSAKPRKRGGKRYASIAVRTSRGASVRLVVQRKVGKRWRKVSGTTRATSASNRVALRTKRLKRGRYRVRVVVSSAAGSAPSVTKAFRVR